MIKVLYIIDSLKAYGAEKSLVLLATSFKQVQPVFISLGCQVELQALLESKGIKVYSGIFNENTSKSKAIKEIAEIVKNEQPSIIHSTLFKSDSISRKLKVRFPQIPLVGSLVSNSYSKNRYKKLSLFSRLKLFRTQMQDRLTSQKVDFFISNSEAIVRSNMKALGIPENKIRIIHRGRALPLTETKHNHNILEKFSGKKVFISVGRLSDSKGQMDLVGAFKKIDLKRLNIVLLIIGDGPDYQRLKKEITANNLQDHIKLMGYRKDVDYLLHYANFFIFPSYYEGLPGALIEAVMAKVPCVVSDIPENRECFPIGGGLFFEAGNVQSIVQKIEESLEYSEWEEEVERNYQHAAKNFSLELAVKKYEEFYIHIFENYSNIIGDSNQKAKMKR